MSPRLVLLLGKPPKRGTIVAEVVEILDGRDVRTEVVLPHERELDAAWLAELGATVDSADLVVHRGLSTAVDPLLEELVASGTPMCNSWAGTRHARDRALTQDALVAAGVPTPLGVSVDTWQEVLELGAERPVVVKLAGSGRGTGVLLGTTGLPDVAPGDGPYRVEHLVVHDGVDRKLYVAGDRVHGLLKDSTLVSEHSTEGTPFEVPPAMRDLALAAAEALDLHLVGVDVIVGHGAPHGEVDGHGDGATGDGTIEGNRRADEPGLYVVDVNPFPGFRSVTGAAESVADHLLGHLDRPIRRDGIPEPLPSEESAAPAS